MGSAVNIIKSGPDVKWMLPLNTVFFFPRWVTYEYGNYRGRQFLLSPAEVPNWYEFSGCRQIGSLRPFVQVRVFPLQVSSTLKLFSFFVNVTPLFSFSFKYEIDHPSPSPEFWIWALFLVLRGGDGFWKCHHTKISLWALRTLPGPGTLQFWQIPWENPDASAGWSSAPQSRVPSDPSCCRCLLCAPDGATYIWPHRGLLSSRNEFISDFETKQRGCSCPPMETWRIWSFCEYRSWRTSVPTIRFGFIKKGALNAGWAFRIRKGFAMASFFK